MTDRECCVALSPLECELPSPFVTLCCTHEAKMGPTFERLFGVTCSQQVLAKLERIGHSLTPERVDLLANLVRIQTWSEEGWTGQYLRHSVACGEQGRRNRSNPGRVSAYR